MSYLLVVLSVYFLLGIGVEFGAWVVLAYGISLVLGDMVSILFFYVQMNSWVGMDTMSFILVMLSLLIFMISVVSSFKDIKIKKDLKEISSLSMVEAISLVVFCSVMFFSVVGWMEFFFFFEFSLIPTLFLILKWGYQPERLQAGVMMMMYTVSGSFPLLIGLLFLWSGFGSDNMLLAKMSGMLVIDKLDWIWVTLFLGFLVKLPVYGVHGWLPNAHVEAPLSGSMLLAGVLLKFGGYGIVRVIWVFQVKMTEMVLLLMVVSLWGGFISSCICLCQNDLKSLIAYSSIGHMALCISSLFSYYPLGKMACVCMLFAHGLCSPILFSLAASSYDLAGSRNIVLSKGMLRSFPVFSGCWFLLCIINMGFPPSLNFFSEVFCISSMMWYSVVFCILGGLMCFMGGCYCLILYSLVNHGSLSQLIRSNNGLSSRYLFSCVFVVFILFSGFFCADFFFV